MFVTRSLPRWQETSQNRHIRKQKLQRVWQMMLKTPLDQPEIQSKLNHPSPALLEQLLDPITNKANLKSNERNQRCINIQHNDHNSPFQVHSWAFF